MSAPQGSSGCRITVDPSTADVLRIEAKKVLMFNHEPFEDFLDYVPTKQLMLADVFRDATAVIDALGWDPENIPQRESVEVPLTAGHVQQLHKRRCDLLDTNLDLLTDHHIARRTSAPGSDPGTRMRPAAAATMAAADDPSHRVEQRVHDTLCSTRTSPLQAHAPMIADAMGAVPLTTTLRVRYVECDMQGHVFNGHYLTWFDIAHTEALRAATGVTYPELVAAHGIDFVVAESGVRYLAPAHFDDLLEVAVTFEPLTSSSLTSRFTIVRDGVTIATGFLRHVCVDGKDFKKLPWPDPVREALAPYVVPSASNDASMPSRPT